MPGNVEPPSAISTPTAMSAGTFRLAVAAVGFVAVGGILVAPFVAFGYLRAKQRANIDTAKSQIKMFDEVIGKYRTDVGDMPADDQGLQILRTQPLNVDATKWHGPYIDETSRWTPGETLISIQGSETKQVIGLSRLHLTAPTE